MACPRCKMVPDAHSFNYFGTIADRKYYYTSPARARDYKETSETLTYYKLHINNAKTGEWVWIIDCAGMEIIKNMVKVLLDEHNGFLQKIYIIHPNTWIKTAMTVMKPFLKRETLDKILIIEGEKVELIVALEKLGLKGAALNWLLSVFGMPFEPAVLPTVPN